MNIIELAKQAGFSQLDFYGNKVGTNVADCLTRFATLVRAQALDEAAGVCDNSASYCRDDGLLQLVLKSNAAAIRQLMSVSDGKVKP